MNIRLLECDPILVVQGIESSTEELGERFCHLNLLTFIY